LIPEWDLTNFGNRKIPFFLFFSDITPEWDLTYVEIYLGPGSYGRLPK
jgi:hypothetical protein